MRRNHKVLLVGAKGYQQTGEGVRVDCCLWSALSKLDNIRDYDTVILDLLELQTDGAKKAVDWPHFDQQFNFRNAVDILSNRGTIIVVGDPRFRIPVGALDRQDSESPEDQPFLTWTGIKFTWESEPGDTVHFAGDYKHRRFERYVSKLTKWNYSLGKCAIDRDVLPQGFNVEYMKMNDFDIVLEKDLFCVNRYQRALAFMLRFKHLKRNGYRHGDDTGPLIFLPPIALNPDETRQVVLADICGAQASIGEPEWIEEWIDEFPPPGQRQIDEEIKRIEADLELVAKKATERG